MIKFDHYYTPENDLFKLYATYCKDYKKAKQFILI